MYCDICSAENAMPFGPEEEICETCLLKLQRERIEELEKRIEKMEVCCYECGAILETRPAETALYVVKHDCS